VEWNKEAVSQQLFIFKRIVFANNLYGGGPRPLFSLCVRRVIGWVRKNYG
jgi:hypothetical protein